jgi:hypothetical protein
MSNAKVRARRRRRGNRAWTAAMSPVELALVPLPRGATPALLETVAHSCHVLKNGEPRTTETHLTSSQPNFQNLKRLAGRFAGGALP